MSTTHLLEIGEVSRGGGGGDAGGGDGSGAAAAQPPATPRRSASSDGAIRFTRVSLDAPDGTPLVRDLTFEVTRGVSVLLMGPNGCGKSSLFRVMAGLWPLQAGEVALPPARDVFYLSQRPYLVAGTLRDQLLYPHPPAAVWAATPAAARAQYVAVAGAAPPELTPELDAGELKSAGGRERGRDVLCWCAAQWRRLRVTGWLCVMQPPQHTNAN